MSSVLVPATKCFHECAYISCHLPAVGKTSEQRPQEQTVVVFANWYSAAALTEDTQHHI